MRILSATASSSVSITRTSPGWTLSLSWPAFPGLSCVFVVADGKSEPSGFVQYKVYKLLDCWGTRPGVSLQTSVAAGITTKSIAPLTPIQTRACVGGASVGGGLTGSELLFWSSPH